MDALAKVICKGKQPDSPQLQGRDDGRASDLVALLKDFSKHVEVLSEESTAARTNSGSAKSGEESAFHALFEAPLGTKNPEKRQEIDELYHRMRNILHNPKYVDGGKISLEDEMAVRDVLKYHHKCEEKTGPGIDYIKIQQIFNHHTRCFWVVRADGSEIDFSYHKCLKGKAAQECPDLLEQYDVLYRNYKPRPKTRRNVALTRV